MSSHLFAYYYQDKFTLFRDLVLAEELHRKGKNTTKKTILTKSEINAKDRFGRTILHIAVSECKNNYVQALLKNENVDLLAQDEESGYTALHRAFLVGNIPAAILILERGKEACLRIKDKEGLSPFDLLDYTLPVIRPSQGELANEVYSFGSNSNCLLGFPDSDDRSHPEKIHLCKDFKVYTDSAERFANVHVLDVQLSRFHTVILTDEEKNNVYICGIGTGGRLGFATDVQFTPMQVFVHDRKIVKVCVTNYHTIVLTDSGALYSWGNSINGVLGYSMSSSQRDEAVQLSPRRIIALKEMNVIGICACDTHCIAYTNTDVYTWGLNNGQLGHVKTQEVITSPKRVAGLSSLVVNCACNEYCTICLLDNNSIWVMTRFTQFRLQVIVDTPSSSLTITAHPQSSKKNIYKKMVVNDTFLCILTELGEVIMADIRPFKDQEPLTKGKIKFKLAWTFQRAQKAAMDIALGSNDTLLLCTLDGSAWKRIKRSKPRDDVQRLHKRQFKYERVGDIQRITAVRSNSHNSFFVLRSDYRVDPIPQDVPSVDSVLFNYFPEQLRMIAGREGTTNDSNDTLSKEQLCLLLSKIELPHTDTVVKTDTFSMHCHRAILATRSSPLADLLSNSQELMDGIVLNHHSNGQWELTLTGFSDVAIAIILVYLYTDVLLVSFLSDKENTETKNAVLSLARALKLSKLEDVLQYTFVRQPPSSFLQNLMEFKRNTPLFESTADIVVSASDKNLYCHKVFLNGMSGFFASVMQFKKLQDNSPSGIQKVSVMDTQSELMRRTINSVYDPHGSYLSSWEGVETIDEWLHLIYKLFLVADEFLFFRLRKEIAIFLLRFLNLKTLPELMVFAKDFHIDALYARCVDYACYNIQYYLEGNKLCQLENQHISAITKKIKELQLSSSPNLRSNAVLNRMTIKYPILGDTQKFSKRILIEFFLSDEEGVFWPSIKRVQGTMKVPMDTMHDEMHKSPRRKSLAEPSVETTSVRVVSDQSASSPRQPANMKASTFFGPGSSSLPTVAEAPSTPDITKTTKKLAELSFGSPQDVDVSSARQERKRWSSETTVQTPKVSLSSLMTSAKQSDSVKSPPAFTPLKQPILKKSQKEKHRDKHKQQQSANSSMLQQQKLSSTPSSSPASTQKPKAWSTTPKSSVKKGDSLRDLLRREQALSSSFSSVSPSRSTPSKVFSPSPVWRKNSVSPLASPSSSIPLKSPGRATSLTEIMLEQQLELEEERTKKMNRKSIKEIQQEEEFQQWWERESARYQQQMALEQQAEETAIKASMKPKKGKNSRRRSSTTQRQPPSSITQTAPITIRKKNDRK